MYQPKIKINLIKIYFYLPLFLIMNLNNILEFLIDKFDSLDVVSKIMVHMIYTNALIFGCIFTIIFNLYGNYLLDKFKLEIKYPRIAKFINYRKKLSKYYLISNFLFIIIVCLVNITLGFAVLTS